MPHSYLKVVGNLGYGCNNSSPRYSVRTTMPPLYTFENFLRFQVQDKHNASSFSNMSWIEFPPIQLQRYEKYLIFDGLYRIKLIS